MDIDLCRQLGNMEQIAGVREARLLRGRGQHAQIAEFYNAAGLRFTVTPDRCMDLYDFSYKGVNLSFQSKNGVASPQAFCPAEGEFFEQWPGGMLVTCGLDNVGGRCAPDGNYPVHGRISWVPASSFGAEARWDGDRYLLRAAGEVHQTRLYGRHLSIRREIETELWSKAVQIHDTITNFEAEDEPYMLLYHFNFGFPLLQGDSIAALSPCSAVPMNSLSTDREHMLPPVDGRGEELYFCTGFGETACGVVYNRRLELGAYVRFGTENLPHLLEWKNMKSHDYVLALEPCNTWGLNREEAAARRKLAVLPGYSSVENRLELGVLDGMEEIREFLRAMDGPSAGAIRTGP